MGEGEGKWDACVWGGGGGGDVLSSRPILLATWHFFQNLVNSFFPRLLSSQGELITLAPGQTIVQRSTMILMHGSLIQKRVHTHTHHHRRNQSGTVSDESTARRDSVVAVVDLAMPIFKPPSLLLWLPDFLDFGLAHFFKHGEAVTYIAGPSGATVLACDADPTAIGAVSGGGGGIAAGDAFLRPSVIGLGTTLSSTLVHASAAAMHGGGGASTLAAEGSVPVPVRPPLNRSATGLFTGAGWGEPAAASAGAQAARLNRSQSIRFQQDM